MIATQRPAYLVKKQQQQQQEQQEQQFHYVLYRGEVRGKFESCKLAQKWAEAFYYKALGEPEAEVVTGAIATPKPLPKNRCKVLPGEMPIGEHIPLIGESHHLWDWYHQGYLCGLVYWDSSSRPRNPFAWPEQRQAWESGVEAGMIQGMLDD